MKNLPFDDRDRLLIAEVAQRLEPRRAGIARSWAQALPLAAPPLKIPAMRRTLAALADRFTAAFFHALTTAAPQQALALHDQFCENLLRRQIAHAAPDRPPAIAPLMRAARLMGEIVDREICLLCAPHGLPETAARLAWSRLWNLASEALALTCARLCEQLASQRQNELRAARDAALEASRLKSAFVADITHEIRTPLNVILGYADLMTERLAEINDERGLEFADPIRRAGQRLLNTIGAVLDLSRIESGAFEVQPVRIRLADMVERQVTDLGVLAHQKGIGLVCQIDAPHATVLFDEHCLSNTIINLLHNAIKFTDRGTVSLRVFLDHAGLLVLEVRDSGEGIDEAYLPHLFEPFSQEGRKSARGHQGAGLGLTLVKRYVELNHARIAVRSTKHSGTVFTITFAAQTADDSAN